MSDDQHLRPGREPPDGAGPPGGEPDIRQSRQARRRDRRAAARVAAQVVRREPVAYLMAMACWITWHTLPAVSAVALKLVLDRIEPDSAGSLWPVLAAFAGIELGRWLVFFVAVHQFFGCWVFWHALPQVNMLSSLSGDDGPVAGRLPASSGEAVSRFRDDSGHLAELIDVWLDITGVSLAATFALVVMASVDVRLTVAVALPVLVAVWVYRRVGGRLQQWRLRERKATAAVTGFIGDTFGAIGAIKLAGAEASVARRFTGLNTTRARAARIDQVATQVLETFGGAVGHLGVGLVALVLLPALADDAATIGDMGMFAASITTLAGLARWTARLGAKSRQATVSVQRLAELFPDQAEARIGAPTVTALRHGPGTYGPAGSTGHNGQNDRNGQDDRLERLEVRGLTVARAGLVDVDLTIDPGTLTVVTGPVGSGKSTLLRALLGLVGSDRGEIRWNGHLLEDPGRTLQPPRAAYVAQTPRLFSEPLVDAVLLGHEPPEVADTLDLVRLTHEVEQMPDGVHTVVGTRGVRLSGGQVQRVATARALVRRPELLVIDDLSSALDVETEAELWRGLLDGADGSEARAGALLVVSHRPAVLARADQVLRLPG